MYVHVHGRKCYGEKWRTLSRQVAGSELGLFFIHDKSSRYNDFYTEIDFSVLNLKMF